jgi:hypothetical protein
MASHVLNPCPHCGRRFDFPVTGCMTFVAESLIANSGGRCPNCGTMVVFDGLPPHMSVVGPLVAAETPEEKLKVNVVDLPLPVRCRAKIYKLNVETLGDLLCLSKNIVRSHLADSPNCFPEIEEMLNEHGLEWKTH